VCNGILAIAFINPLKTKPSETPTMQAKPVVFQDEPTFGGHPF